LTDFKRYRKQLKFDLDTKVCEQIFGKGYRRVYDDIKCIRDIRTADIIEVNSINHYFDYDGTPGKFADYAQGKNNVKDDLSNYY
jgi:hypothetical protein